jgi:hypothetical protein
MRSRLWIIGALALTLGGCVTSPKQTVLDLDTTDRRWTTKRCVAAREAVARYDEQRVPRKVVSVVGNLAAPFVGTAASLAWSASKDDERADLNHRVRSACISDPLKGKRPGKGKRSKSYARR